jgi:hypothetical protein
MLPAGRYGVCISVVPQELFSSQTFRAALGLMQPPTQWVSESFPWGKAVRAWGWPLTSISAEVKNEWIYTSTPLHAFTTWTGTTSTFYFLKLIVPLNNTSTFISYFTENTLILYYKTREINRLILWNSQETRTVIIAFSKLGRVQAWRKPPTFRMSYSNTCFTIFRVMICCNLIPCLLSGRNEELQ